MDRLTAMEVPVRVVETGSFSGAARLLRVGQPAVSKTLAQLEERLGSGGLGRWRQCGGAGPTEAAMLKRFTGNAEHKAGFISGPPRSR
jgi:DNA-binding transcriptional LysR family regulator